MARKLYVRNIYPSAKDSKGFIGGTRGGVESYISHYYPVLNEIAQSSNQEADARPRDAHDKSPAVTIMTRLVNLVNKLIGWNSFCIS